MYLKIATTWKSKFSHCNFVQVPRSENSHADSSATLASIITFQFKREIPIEYILKPNINKSDEEVLHLNTSLEWMDPIMAYLQDGTVPGDKAEAQKLQHLATRYILLGDLYKKSYSKLHSDPYLRCLGSEEARKVMQEIHYDDCGHHTGSVLNVGRHFRNVGRHFVFKPSPPRHPHPHLKWRFRKCRPTF